MAAVRRLTGEEKNALALRAALDSESGIARTVAGFSSPHLSPGTYIHYRTVSALVGRGLLEYVGRGRATITANGRRELERLEQGQ